MAGGGRQGAGGDFPGAAPSGSPCCRSPWRPRDGGGGAVAGRGLTVTAAGRERRRDGSGAGGGSGARLNGAMARGRRGGIEAA